LPQNGELSRLSDEELVAGIERGSEAHFSELYARYFQRVYAFTCSRVRNRADVDEVVQEIFTAVFRSLSSFRGDSRLLTWIFGIARNSINSQLRRLRQEDEHLAALDPENLQPAPSFDVCTPEEHLALRRYVGAIQDQLRSVSQWQLDVFRLRHEENLPIREIALRTQRSGDAIRSSLYRVKRLVVGAVEEQRASAGAPRPRRGWSAA
jgi:RNA polymerase sigma-70 factor (ECF subfamily)